MPKQGPHLFTIIIKQSNHITAFHVALEQMDTSMMHINIIGREIANTIRLSHFIRPEWQHTWENGSLWQRLERGHIFILMKWKFTGNASQGQLRARFMRPVAHKPELQNLWPTKLNADYWPCTVAQQGLNKPVSAWHCKNCDKPSSVFQRNIGVFFHSSIAPILTLGATT